MTIAMDCGTLLRGRLPEKYPIVNKGLAANSSFTAGENVITATILAISGWRALRTPVCQKALRGDDGYATAGRRASHAAPHRRCVGRSQLIESLGRGTFGEVWRARDTQLDRAVAVEVPRNENLTAGERDKSLREARAVAQLERPGIVGVHEVGGEDNGGMLRQAANPPSSMLEPASPDYSCSPCELALSARERMPR
jgi:hypothetical protein